METVQRLSLSGFKSIKSASLDLGAVNVFIGENGAGKSNLISFFKLLNELMAERLQQFIARSGYAHSLLHYGAKRTPQIEASLDLRADKGINNYTMRLFHVAGDTLAFADESVSFTPHGASAPRATQSLGMGHAETKLNNLANDAPGAARVIRHLLNYCRVYHFHDTSQEASVRQPSLLSDDRWLAPDARNLATMLLRFRRHNDADYSRIVSTIRQVVPYFGNFVLDIGPDSDRHIALRWTEQGSDQVFGSHQLSDGTLRAICLITLLLQPLDLLPRLIVVDEPELGLHPAAQVVLGALLKKASHHCQVLIATQSASLLDQFAPEDVIVVDRTSQETTFRRLRSDDLKVWLDEYTLGELWRKNVLGGGPLE